MTLDRRHEMSKGYSGGKHQKSGRFVIQEHRTARGSHWDLRMELNGTYKSWTIPKGPSVDPRKPRLAIETPFHEIKYGEWEGVIEKGLYGAGKVIQWDAGRYKSSQDFERAIKEGKIEFKLKGQKLKGSWVLIKTSKGWILRKMKDEYAERGRDIVRRERKSVKSGKTVENVTKDDGYISNAENLGW